MEGKRLCLYKNSIFEIECCEVQ